MTRKDYNAIASVINEAGRNAAYMTDDDILHRIVYGISEHLAKDNPRFDRERFRQACGVRR